MYRGEKGCSLHFTDFLSNLFGLIWREGDEVEWSIVSEEHKTKLRFIFPQHTFVQYTIVEKETEERKSSIRSLFRDDCRLIIHFYLDCFASFLYRKTKSSFPWKSGDFLASNEIHPIWRRFNNNFLEPFLEGFSRKFKMRRIMYENREYVSQTSSNTHMLFQLLLQANQS